MTTVPARAAGWYDDETDAALLRYWDGTRWSPHTAARPTDDADTSDDADDAIDEHTTARSPRPPDEHTTVPLPPEPGPAASGDLLEKPTKHRRTAWIVTGALVALGLVSTVVWSVVTALVR